MQRREARAEILKALYKAEFTSKNHNHDQNPYLENDLGDQKDFVEQILYGTLDKQQEIDDMISSFTKGWKVERLAVIDRNVLRMAIYELIFYKDTPVEIVINEAIELSKKYGTENAPKFVNGILDKLWKEYGDSE